ncbi:MAG: phage tail protein [bacterium]
MSELRPFSLIRDGDQWVRSSFDRTFLDYEHGIVELAWTTKTLENEATATTPGAGLAFDNECRLYHSLPDAGAVERVLWAARDVLAPSGGAAAASAFFAAAATGALGDFASAGTQSTLREPRGLAVDENDRLFVAESANGQVLVYDLWSERLLRRVTFGGERPTDLSAHGAFVWVVLAASGRVAKLTAGGGPDDVALPAGCTNPSRIAVSTDGSIALLCDAATATAQVWIIDGAGKPSETFGEPFATDVEWESTSVLVIARRPGADFIRLRVGQPARELVGPLRARGYDGLGIVRTPERLPDASGRDCHCGGTCGCDGGSFRIGYWTAHGFRLAVPARLLYERVGRVTTYRLDSGAFQTQWGRVFLDACIPLGTSIRVRAIALDETDDDATMPRTPPASLERVTILRPDLSPPMPPLASIPTEDVVEGRIHERESGRELPWTQPGADDPFRTYEGWIAAPAGRYLWLTFELSGNTQLTPRIKCIRAEHPAHDYLRRLPKLFSREEREASFLRRYLAMFEGFLGETEARGVDRDLLLTPQTAPDEVLPWLASFLGLVLDERWARAPRAGGRTADARREIIELAAWLFRFRGTVPGLRKFIELYVGVDVVLLEHFRLRARMAAMLGGVDASASSSMLGVGFRLGDALGEPGASASASDSHAHRFTVLIPASLTEEQLEVVRQILVVHRPAHTIFDVCSVGAGMRLGRGLHVGLSSMIGATGGFSTAQLGGSALGRGAIIGRPSGGTSIGASRLNSTARVR